MNMSSLKTNMPPKTLKLSGSANAGNTIHGVSPVVTLEETEAGVEISIKDVDGVKNATISHGKDGKDGVDGQNGYTPVKGVDYFDGKDGYTPVKGVDYFDGKDGVDGKDGKDGTDVDLTDYATKEYVDEKVAEGGSGGGVTSWNDLEDKPFYETGGESELLLKNSISFTMVSGSGRISPGALGFTPVTGNKYRVEISFTSPLYGNVVIDETVTATSETGFSIDNANGKLKNFYKSPMAGWAIEFNSMGVSSGTCNLRISENSYTIKHLDEKFIPESIATKEYVDNQIAEHADSDIVVAWKNVTDKPFQENVFEREVYSKTSVVATVSSGIASFMFSSFSPVAGLRYKVEVKNASGGATLCYGIYVAESSTNMICERQNNITRLTNTMNSWTINFSVSGVSILSCNLSISETSEECSIYESYIPETIARTNYVDEKFNELAEKEVDLTDYATKEYVDEKVAEGGGSSGGVTSWNDLEDKPFGSEVVESTIEFNGDLTGYEIYPIDSTTSYVKMSDSTPTVDELIGQTVSYYLSTTGGFDEFEITSDLMVTESGATAILVPELGMPVVILTESEFPEYGLPKGLFYLYAEADGVKFYAQSISGLSALKEIIATLDEKYIPESVFDKIDDASNNFIDVTALPSTGIAKGKIYRVVDRAVKLTGTGEVDPEVTVHCVEELPETGDPDDNVYYYNVKEKALYQFYFNQADGVKLWAKETRYKVCNDDGNINVEHTGSMAQYVLITPKLYVYDVEWNCIGIDSGDGLRSEVFNTTLNTASGDYSHAEGYRTHATGTYGHAEGYRTTSSAWASHAEGSDTTASGTSSHAEGSGTTASNSGSHAEGADTTASGQ